MVDIIEHILDDYQKRTMDTFTLVTGNREIAGVNTGKRLFSIIELLITFTK